MLLVGLMPATDLLLMLLIGPDTSDRSVVDVVSWANASDRSVLAVDQPLKGPWDNYGDQPSPFLHHKR